METKSTKKKNKDKVIRVLLIGCGKKGSTILQFIKDIEEIEVVGVVESNTKAKGIHWAKDNNIKVFNKIEDINKVESIDLILEISSNPKIRKKLLEDLKIETDIVTPKGAHLIWDLLKDKIKKQEITESYRELKQSYDKFKEHERDLEKHRQDLENTNIELEKRLSEIFFTHEFFKALTSFINVEDVCNLISDGANGILGAEISGVYLKIKDQNRLFLQACQGRSTEELLPELNYGETIVGECAKQKCLINIPDMKKNDYSTFMLEEEITSQIAVPLSIGHKILGVLVIASTIHRSLTEEEIDRLSTISNMASLALQNALFNQELEKLSITDRLTELYNHGYFQQRLEEELHRAERSQNKLSLILLDIDYFKKYNDAFGHPSGDKLLQKISKLIKEQLRDTDVAARYGGEEFVVILPETHKDGAMIVAERMRKAVEKEEFKGDKDNPVIHKTISLGIATFPDDASSQSNLIEVCDQALYKAKHVGRNKTIDAEKVIDQKTKTSFAN